MNFLPENDKRCRVISMDTGLIQVVPAAHAYSDDRVDRREAMIGNRQTHMILWDKQADSMASVSIERFQLEPHRYTSPAYEDNFRLRRKAA